MKVERRVAGPRQVRRRPVRRPSDPPRRRTRRDYVAPEGRTVAAGRALLVTLLAFGIWLGLDARQLYNAANASPLGVRRSVATAILSPIARAQEFVGLDRIVNGANRALGRDNGTTPGLAAIAPPATVPGTHHGRHLGKTTPGNSGQPQQSVTTTTAPTSFLQPSAVHPLTVLTIGDSIGEDLGYGLVDVLGTNKSISLVRQSQGNTGLANTAYYNWPANLARELQQYHPGVVVALFGGNDWQPFIADGREAEQGSAFWRQQYEARVRQLVDMVTASGARMFWVGLPIMSPSGNLAGPDAPTLNSVYQQACAGNPNATYVSIYKLFENASGQYAQWLPDASGSLVEVRDPDGVHIAPPAGDDLAANAVVHSIEAQLHISI